MQAKILTAPTHCACCGEQLQAGEQFRWVDKQVAAGSKVGSYRTVYRPAHVDRYCGARKFRLEQLHQDIADTERSIITLESELASASPEVRDVVMRVMRDRISAARADIAIVSSW